MSDTAAFRKFELRAPSAQNAVDVFEGQWASDLASVCPGVKAGDTPLFTADRRPLMLAEIFGKNGRLDQMSVLELGPLEGAHTYLLEKLGAARILSIEANIGAFLKCLIVKELTGITAAKFMLGDFGQYLKDTTERFDVVMCSGVLYHMEDPIALIRAIARVTEKCFVWTHYYDEGHYPGPPRQARTDPRYPNVNLYTLRYGDVESGRFWGGNQPTSVWLKRDDIINAFREAGFASIQVIRDDPTQRNGASITFGAARNEALVELSDRSFIRTPESRLGSTHDQQGKDLAETSGNPKKVLHTAASVSKSPSAEGFLGRVEGIIDDEVIGWIVNLSGTRKLEDVICIGENGGSVRFRSSIYRPGLCARYRRAGTFGFAIPLRALRALGETVQVTAADGSVLENGVLECGQPSRADTKDGETPRIFLHIAKTAGTSIRSALVSHYRKSEVALVYPQFPGISIAEFVELPAVQKQAFRLVMGHLSFGTHQLLGRDARYITFLRDPIRRLVSRYWHSRGVGQSTFTHNGVELPLSAALNDGLSVEFDNHQTRVLSSVGLERAPLGDLNENWVETALANIRAHFDFVGFVETIGEDFPEMCRILGVPAHDLRWLNSRKEEIARSDDEDFKRIDWAAVRHNHRFDLALYAAARSMRATPVSRAADSPPSLPVENP